MISKHFKRSEFACPCGNCRCDTVDAELIEVLEAMRFHFGGNVIHINSGHRCPTHNLKVKGTTNSMHKHARAADVVIENIAPTKVQDYLLKRYEGRYGIGSYNTFTHIDTRDGMARWTG